MTWYPMQPLGMTFWPHLATPFIRTHWNPLEHFGTPWNNFGQILTTLNEFEQFGTHWNPLEQLFYSHLVTPFIRTPWNPLEPLVTNGTPCNQWIPLEPLEPLEMTFLAISGNTCHKNPLEPFETPWNEFGRL